MAPFPNEPYESYGLKRYWNMLHDDDRSIYGFCYGNCAALVQAGCSSVILSASIGAPRAPRSAAGAFAIETATSDNLLLGLLFSG